MPIYEYKCQKCKAQFEKLIGGCGIQSPQVCPGCGSKNIKKLVSTFSCSSGDSKKIETSDANSGGCTSSCKTCPGCR